MFGMGEFPTAAVRVEAAGPKNDAEQRKQKRGRAPSQKRATPRQGKIEGANEQGKINNRFQFVPSGWSVALAAPRGHREFPYFPCRRIADGGAEREATMIGGMRGEG